MAYVAIVNRLVSPPPVAVMLQRLDVEPVNAVGLKHILSGMVLHRQTQKAEGRSCAAPRLIEMERLVSLSQAFGILAIGIS